MTQDAVSDVASWLTTASADGTEKPPPTSLAVNDPVFALIAEEKRLEALWIAADGKRHDRQAEAIDERMGAILNQLRNTKPVTLAGAIAMLELANATLSLIDVVIEGLRDMQAKGARQETPDDSKILALFREWMQAERAAGGMPDGDDDTPEEMAALDHADSLFDQIAEVRAAGLVGFAIKAYCGLHATEGGNYSDPAAMCLHTPLDRSLMEDAARFVPELAPLVGSSQETPDVIGFGKPDERP